VGPKTGMGSVEQGKIPCSCRESNLGRSARSSSLYRLSYPDSIVSPYKFNNISTLRNKQETEFYFRVIQTNVFVYV
jgi:hypothetical protein